MRDVGVVVLLAVVATPNLAEARCRVRLEATASAGGWGFIGDGQGGADGFGIEMVALHAPRCGIAVFGARTLLLFGTANDPYPEIEQRPQKAALDIAPIVGLSIPFWRLSATATAGPALTSLRPDRDGPAHWTVGAAVDAGLRARLSPNFWLGARLAHNINEEQTARAILLELSGVADL